MQSIQGLASAHEDETLIMVSHREGIWEVLQHFGLRPHKEYCSIHYLWYDHDTQSICIWDPEKVGEFPVGAFLLAVIYFRSPRLFKV